MQAHVVTSSDAPAPIGPYSQALRLGPWLLCSGQIPLDPATGYLVDGDVTAQTRQVLNNCQAVLAAADLTPHHVVRATFFLTDLADFSTVNDLWAAWVGPVFPVRSTVEVAALPRGARIEIEITAFCGDSP